MCLAVPIKVAELDMAGEVAVDCQGRRVKTKLVGECKVGDYLLVQSNIAVEKITQQRAQDLVAALNLKGL